MCLYKSLLGGGGRLNIGNRVVFFFFFFQHAFSLPFPSLCCPFHLDYFPVKVPAFLLASGKDV